MWIHNDASIPVVRRWQPFAEELSRNSCHHRDPFCATRIPSGVTPVDLMISDANDGTYGEHPPSLFLFNRISEVLLLGDVVSLVPCCATSHLSLFCSTSCSSLAFRWISSVQRCTRCLHEWDCSVCEAGQYPLEPIPLH
jgi:hypothetical protein